MGGKALKIKTVRKNTDELYRIYNEISPIIHSKLIVETHLIQFYLEKETHGDLDILLKVDKQLPDLSKWVKKSFNPQDIHYNGGVVSFDYDNFQVDLIPIKSSNWESSKCYFDYDPSGNLFGKISHSMGFKYGHEGLSYPMRNFSGRQSENIILSKNNKEIFEFLGYDYNEYSKGFNKIEDIFNFVINGKYFSCEKFNMENLSNIDRKRNKKRASYQSFLKYLKDENINTNFKFNNKEWYLDYADSFFQKSNLIEKINSFQKIDQINKEISLKFNGNIIMGLYPDLKGKELGNVMSNFKSQFDNFKEYLISNNQEKILNDFKKWYEKGEN